MAGLLTRDHIKTPSRFLSGFCFNASHTVAGTVLASSMTLPISHFKLEHKFKAPIHYLIINILNFKSK
tara:strand:- start:72 stop:275 length:204 start_codon:yes stop_codon:yes gene_type:complete